MQPIKCRSISNGKIIWWEVINLPRMKPSYFAVAILKNELMIDKSIHVVDTSSWTQKSGNCDRNYKPYDVIGL